MKSYLQEIITDFVSLVYPRYCSACNNGLAKGEEILCSQCRLDLPRTNFHLNRENPLFNRLNGRFPVQFACSYFFFRKGGKVQQLLHAMKYGNQPEVGEVLGRVYGKELFDFEFQKYADVLVPVPLHQVRKRRRGFNQSEMFANGLSQSLGLPTELDAIERVTQTETQTHKSKLSRWENVETVFRSKNINSVKGRRVILVDDVVTTGATIEACAQTLLNMEAVSVGVVSIAYTQDK